MVCAPDSQLQVKPGHGESKPPTFGQRPAILMSTSTFRFNSQPLTVAFTEQQVLAVELGRM